LLLKRFHIFTNYMNNWRWLLLPFSLIYGLVVIVRNWLYDGGLLKSRRFAIPVICVGNLDVGGAGKSPMTEYLVRLLRQDNRLATLSRGYGRNTQGFLIASANATAAEIGDEPSQFKHKFQDVTVAVCEDRATGIQNLKKDHNLVILDDGYQHRAVKPGFSILMFDYGKIYDPHWLLPAGNMREPFSGRWRADILVVSKCPENMPIAEQTSIAERLEPLPFQALFFSSIAYQPLQDMKGKKALISPDADTTVFLLTGIANPAPLVRHIKNITPHIIHHNYPDHHRFSLKNIAKLADEFQACPAQKKVIITTEKDAQRLGEHELQPAVEKLPVMVLPVAARFLNDSGAQFNQLVTAYVREYRTNHIIH
jgi:tetraacyldisaccharide 4'-kinase